MMVASFDWKERKRGQPLSLSLSLILVSRQIKSDEVVVGQCETTSVSECECESGEIRAVAGYCAMENTKTLRRESLGRLRRLGN